MEKPSVTCLCLTISGREQFLNRAVECFNRQTYEDRQLLIVVDTYADWPPVDFADCDDNVSVVVAPNAYLKIGEKRNFGCSWVDTDLIALWDDDDYSAPERLAHQVEIMPPNQIYAVTAFDAMKFTDGSNWWQFRCSPGHGIGSSLMFTRDWWWKNPFPEKQVGEDNDFVEVARAAGILSLAPDLNLMYATIHPGNASWKNTSHPQYVPLPGFQWEDGFVRAGK